MANRSCRRCAALAALVCLGMALVPRGVYAATTFSNVTPITINDGGDLSGALPGAATPYPSTITVSGLEGQIITGLTVTVTGITHTFPDDIDMLLVGPAGQNLLLMSDAGGGPNVTNINLTFDDAAAASLPDGTVLSTGTFKPTNFDTNDNFPAPAPAPSASTELAVFNGTAPNGDWNLFVVDQYSSDTGSISGGWQLDITSVPIGALQFTAASYSVAEGAGLATITVERTGGSAGAVTVDYATSDGTATAGADYTAAAGTLSFADGETSQTFTVPITNDTADEPDETVTLTLSNPGGGATLGTNVTAALTITDDDLPPVYYIHLPAVFK